MFFLSRILSLPVHFLTLTFSPKNKREREKRGWKMRSSPGEDEYDKIYCRQRYDMILYMNVSHSRKSEKETKSRKNTWESYGREMKRKKKGKEKGKKDEDGDGEEERHRCMKTMMKYCERGTNISSFLLSSNQIQDLLLFLSSPLPVEVSEVGWKNMKRISFSPTLFSLSFLFLSLLFLSLALCYLFLSLILSFVSVSLSCFPLFFSRLLAERIEQNEIQRNTISGQTKDSQKMDTKKRDKICFANS